MGKRKMDLQRPDEYARYGPIEVGRFGKEVVIKNNMTEEDAKNYISSLANEYPEIKVKIENLVNEIRELVVSYHPLELLHLSYQNMFLSMLGKTSEFQYGFEETTAVRMIDYLQSIIVSKNPKETSYENIDMENWSIIYEKVAELYRSLSHFHFCYSAFLEKTDPNFNDKYNSLYIQAQELRTGVRGQRYSVHEIKHHIDLLTPHDEVFQELFGIRAEEFLLGLEKVQVSLMSGVNDTMINLEYLMEKTLPMLKEPAGNTQEDNYTEMDRVLDEMGLTELKDSFIGQFFGYDLFDVEKVSGLPMSLLQELSWKVGEEENFFSEGEYAGWPLRRLPIEERPFIYVDEKVYCFDLYSLFDNLYRVIQRLIFRLKPHYKNAWNEKQMQVSEQLPLNLFNKLLPGAETYSSIYYRGKTGDKGKKQWCECDGILMYDNHLLVIEVKGGSFTYTHPSTDFKAFIKSIETLAKKPYEQASRFIDTLKTEEEITIYDENHKPLKKMHINEFRHITSCSITIDNFNEFTARINSLSALGIELGDVPAWNISIDELRVYADYFESPSIFLHYLEQRVKASKSQDIEVYDELDHLGLYIEHNDYNKTAELTKGKQVLWQGYREELDNYFGTLMFPELGKPKKPQQQIPEKIKEIISILDKQKKSEFTKVVSMLLDLSGDTRLEIEEKMKMLIEKQLKANKVMPLSIFGEAKITFVCNQSGVNRFEEEQAKEYILATMLKPKDDFRLALYLDYDGRGKLNNVNFEFLSQSAIPPERVIEFQELAEKYAVQRVLSYKRQTGIRKIGRNDSCPCGSGVKHKKCCGK